MNDKEHLTPERIKDLKTGMLSREESIAALEHIGECGRCADAFAGSYDIRELLKLSPGFRPAILTAIEKEKQSVIKAGAKASESRKELLRYGASVSVAACITLFLIFSGTIDYALNFSRSIDTDIPEVNLITENLNGLSNQLLNFEVIKYFKEGL